MRALHAGTPFAALFLCAAIPCGALAQKRTPDTPVDRFGIVEGAQLQFSAEKKDDKITLGLALPTGASQENSFALVVSTPFNGKDRVLPASLDALASGTTATLRWGRFGMGMPDPDARAIEISDQAVRACEARRRSPQSGDPPGLKAEGCASEPNNNIVHAYDPARYREYLAHIIHRDATDYGVEATVGFTDFDWIDQGTFSERKERRTSWGITAHYNRYLRSTKTAFTFSASYQRGYRPVDEMLLCPPGATAPAAQCKTARGSPPTKDEKGLVAVGLRHQFMQNGTLLPIAVAPLVTYDITHHVWGVDVPIYFVPDKASTLNGGIRFGYRSDRKEKFSVGIFVGTSFSLLQ